MFSDIDAMSLPTPPGTSHRDKENKTPRFVSHARVNWSEHNEYHIVPNSPTSTPSRRVSVAASVLKDRQPKSILKATSMNPLPLMDENQRDVTPEPSDPLVDLRYLEGPVSRVVAPDASLRDLIEGYSVLAARLRACVTESTDIDASWPLFQPLRVQRTAFVRSLVRDLGRAMVDPVAKTHVLHEDETKTDTGHVGLTGLPSPKDSPRKKKGMSEEQVKHARDLCTTCHSVLKLLAVIFTLPAIYQIFTDEQLGLVLTQVLAIPLANQLPTPNARKTCALSIWLLQVQRLPAEVLEPARDRVTYALRRGIEGELGKEGKKGSASDGLKAVHDLSIYQPTVFIPAFTELLPSIFANLLAPTLALRAQACHALGGLAYAAAALPPSSIHARISRATLSYLAVPPTTPNKLLSPSKDPLIVRTLRTTLNATDPNHAAQGPVWAISVLANLVVLLGSAVYTEERITTTIVALFSLAMRHPKSSVRALGCLAWRCMTWAYFQPPMFHLDDPETDEDEDEKANEVQEERYYQRITNVSKVLVSVMDMGAGVATIGALLAASSSIAALDEFRLRRALKLLGMMSQNGGQTCLDALDTACQLVSVDEAASTSYEWDWRKLLAPSLFSSSPGLLTADWRTLAPVVRPVFEECVQVADIRALTHEELAEDWVIEGLLTVWKEGLKALKMPWGTEIPAEIQDIWFGLLRANIRVLKATGDDEGIVNFARHAVDVLLDIFQDKELDLSLQPDDIEQFIPTSPIRDPQDDVAVSKAPPPSRWNLGLKLYIVRELWTIVKATFPPTALCVAGVELLDFLNDKEEALVGDIDSTDDVREQWDYLCAEVTFCCDVSELGAFWGTKDCPKEKRRDRTDWPTDVRSVVWCHFIDKWREIGGNWEMAAVLLSVPFLDVNGWEFCNEDLNAWDAFLRLAIDRALDYGVDSVSVIDQVATSISATHFPALGSSARVADLLLSHLDISEARQVPMELIGFVNNTLISTYPPEPRNKMMSMWLLRSLARTVEVCPRELLFNFIEILQDGVCVWVADEQESFTRDEYELDIMPLYQNVALAIQSLPASEQTLNALAPVLGSAFCGRRDKPQAVSQAFSDFWTASYADLAEPPDGWPPKIAASLCALLSQDELCALSDSPIIPYPAVDTEDDDIVEQLLSFENEDEAEDSYNPFVKAHVLAAAFDLPPSSPIRDVSPELPSTPKTSPPTRPHRPQKTGTRDLLGPFLVTPTSPFQSPVTPKRTPHSGARRTLGDSPRSNKENASPLGAFTSITERIAMRSPVTPTLGKRRFVDDAEERPSKRSRVDVSPDVPVLRNIIANAGRLSEPVAANVFFAESAPRKHLKASAARDRMSPKEHIEESAPFSWLDEFDEHEPITTLDVVHSKKRKGVFMDAVEIPSTRKVRKQTPATVPNNLDISAASPSGGRTIRRTRSMTKLLGEELAEPLKTSRKQRRSTQTGSELGFSVSSSPLLGLQDATLIGSDDSMLATPSKHAGAQPSSDDDPYIGQVTPHHLVSPALRRVKKLEFDPPSDDSNMSASPTTERVMHRAARSLGSASKTYKRPAPLKFNARSVSLNDLPPSSEPSDSDD